MVIPPTSELPLRRIPTAVIDWETTWGDDDLRTQRPVSLAIVHCELGVFGSERVVLSEYINPGVPIREEATSIHGIKDEDVMGAPCVETLIPGIKEAIEGRVVAAYNIPFDVPILQRYIPEIDFGTLDPLVWAKVADQFRRGKKLTKVAERRRLKFDAHNAEADAIATAKIMPWLLKDLKSLIGIDDSIFESVSDMWRFTMAAALKWERWYAGYRKKKELEEPEMPWHALID